jgi:hypothetical protein
VRDRRAYGVLFIQRATAAEAGERTFDGGGAGALAGRGGGALAGRGGAVPAAARAARASAFFCARFSSFAARLSFFASSRLRFVKLLKLPLAIVESPSAKKRNRDNTIEAGKARLDPIPCGGGLGA